MHKKHLPEIITALVRENDRNPDSYPLMIRPMVMNVLATYLLSLQFNDRSDILLDTVNECNNLLTFEDAIIFFDSQLSDRKLPHAVIFDIVKLMRSFKKFHTRAELYCLYGVRPIPKVIKMEPHDVISRKI